ncbi:autotransporter domain-containing protein, partial [Salmonella enterica subsp. enterica serovar Istanbul]|nr:autotransporter domain-containing protein [Salmonella enterica subsp. enterica serovar Istanbul]
RLAWAHDWRSDASVSAAFQALSGSSFIVSGAAAPKNVALVTGGAEVTLNKNTTVSAKFDGEFGTGYSSYGGTTR